MNKQHAVKAIPFKRHKAMLASRSEAVSIPGSLNIKSTGCIYQYPAKPVIESVINGFLK